MTYYDYGGIVMYTLTLANRLGNVRSFPMDKIGKDALSLILIIQDAKIHQVC